MLDKQIELNKDLQELLGGNERKLQSMVKGGTAAESDWMNVKVERLNAAQKGESLESQKRMLQNVLSAFCGIEVRNVTKPVASNVATTRSNAGERPEMQLFNAQLSLADAQEQALDAALKPRLGVFAQGYYGYPGYNMFEDMLSRKFSWNGMIGARLTWNIGALYSRKNDKAKIQLQRETAETSRDVFLFNNNLEQIQQNENIERYKKLMADDKEIISLRSSIRKAAESKLSHGIIDVNDLVKEINNENAARVGQSMHEIQMLKEIYDLKYTTNQ
jgi:outer membrane protein TolC